MEMGLDELLCKLVYGEINIVLLGFYLLFDLLIVCVVYLGVWLFSIIVSF